MRILMLTEFYPPIMGGVQQHVRDLSRGLVARGHEVAVATLWHEGLPEREIDGGVRVHRIRGTAQRAGWLFSKGDRQYAPPLPDPELMLALRRIVAHERPDVVHGHTWLVHSYLPLKAWSGVPLVVTLHDYGLVCAMMAFLYRGAACGGPGPKKCLECAAGHYGAAKGVPTVLANWAMSAAERASVDLFVAVSPAVAGATGLAGGRVPFEVIPNFVPDDFDAPTSSDDPRLADLPTGEYLLFVGALGRHKGIEVLLRAYAGLRDPPPLVMIGAKMGDTPSLFPPNVTVLNDWPRAAVMQAWRRCLLGLVPSISPEAFGIVALEAMAASRPVIASRIGGLADVVVDGTTGLLVPAGDAAALAGAIERLLRDAELRERMGRAGNRRLDAFRANAVLPRVEEVYRRVLARRAGGLPDRRTADGWHGKDLVVGARDTTGTA